MVELISSDTYSDNHQEYILALDKILKLNWEFKKIKEKAEREYQAYFSDNSKKEFTDFVNQLGVNGPRNYLKLTRDLLGEYITNKEIYKELDLNKIEIVYHQFSLERLLKKK